MGGGCKKLGDTGCKLRPNNNCCDPDNNICERSGDFNTPTFTCVVWRAEDANAVVEEDNQLGLDQDVTLDVLLFAVLGLVAVLYYLVRFVTRGYKAATKPSSTVVATYETIEVES